MTHDYLLALVQQLVSVFILFFFWFPYLPLMKAAMAPRASGFILQACPCRFPTET